MEIINSVDRDDDRIHLPNIYFSPELEHTFIVILSRIPLWSNIMVTKFNSTRYCSSSAESENYFKQLKLDPGNYHISNNFELNSKSMHNRPIQKMTPHFIENIALKC